MNVPILRSNEFKLFQELIFDLVGITMNETKKPLIGNRLISRLRYFEFDSYLEYYNILMKEKNKDEVQIFIDLLTTNETSFFREPIHFEFMKKAFEKQELAHKLRIWSAACSSGEEPYSIAMLLADKIKNSDWEVVASDISSRVLEKSKSGLYPIEKASKIPTEYLKEFCLKGVGSKAGYFKIEDFIRSKIVFKSINLNESFPNLGKFEVIFLRNVMIYFNKETRIKLIEKISNCLNQGGYLFIGHSETLLEITDKLMMVKPTIYRKK